ncbi:hypothetical protein [Candidatus Frankia alpina]|uniref:hypothetical protein n=1 Tax=Candidatus Frankia alpina TaxID=2699483 RepID=UPI0013D5335E|nr:hypothetical protein [Candidatus Frankia alpina]
MGEPDAVPALDVVHEIARGDDPVVVEPLHVTILSGSSDRSGCPLSRVPAPGFDRVRITSAPT